MPHLLLNEFGEVWYRGVAAKSAMPAAWTRIIRPEVRKRTRYMIKKFVATARNRRKRNKRKLWKGWSDQKSSSASSYSGRDLYHNNNIIIITVVLGCAHALFRVWISGGASEAFICGGGVDERTHGLARVETEPARWFFLHRLHDPSVGARASRYGRQRRTRGRPRGQWAVGWAWPAARPDTIPPRPLPQPASR